MTGAGSCSVEPVPVAWVSVGVPRWTGPSGPASKVSPLPCAVAEPHLVDCHRFRRDHLAYLEQALPGEAQQRAELHVVQCAACGAHDALVRRSLMAVRSLPDLTPTEGFLERLQARLAASGFAACGYPHERGGWPPARTDVVGDPVRDDRGTDGPEADDDHLVLLAWFGLAPRRRPAPAADRGADGAEGDGAEEHGLLARWRRRLRSGSAG